MKIGFYHHGPVADAAVAKALDATPFSIAGRNANHFDNGSVEGFAEVLVDEGANTAAIAAAYEKAGVPVKKVEDFLAELSAQGGKAAEKAAAPAFNPDGKPAPRAAKAQGGKAAEKAQ